MERKILTLLLIAISISAFSQTKVYIDPNASAGGDGSLGSPLNYVPTIESNTTYLFKSGAEMSLADIPISDKHNVKITTYGGTDRFKINGNGSEKNKIFGVSGSNITIENIEVNGNNELCPYLSMYIESNPYAQTKIDNVTITNCKFYNFVSGIRAFGTTNLTVQDCEIYNIGEDGAFISKCDNVSFLNNHIYKVNQGFYTQAQGTTAAGDGIQLEPVKNWKVIGNTIDRSGTGNKFAFIANNRDSAGVKICQNNTFIGPYDAGAGGAIMYITGAADKVDISGNTFIMSNPDKAVSGLWQTVDNAHIHDNIFINVGSSLISNDAVFENNKYAGIDMQPAPYRSWTGTNNLYIGDATNLPDVTVPVDTTTTVPSDTTSTAPDNNGSTPVDSTSVPDNSGTNPAPPPKSTTYSINCGGNDFMGNNGIDYSADQINLFKGGSVDGQNFEINNTNDDILYLSNRYGKTFSYALPVENGKYRIKLLFAEIYWKSIGKRIFNVNIENNPVLQNFDIMDAAGGDRTAISKEFVVEIKDEVLDILFTSVKDNALISGIEVTPYTETATGIGQQKETSISVYPIPAHDMITVDLGKTTNINSTVAVYDITGKMALSSVINAGSSQQSMDISNLTPGIYFVVVPGSNNKKLTKKIIVN